MSMRFHGKVGLFCACSLVAAPVPALALEFSGGVSVGGIQVGTEPELAVSPFIGWLWRRTSDFRIEVHNMLSIVPGAGVGVYDRTAVTFGYTTKTGNISLGPSLAIYMMRVCGAVICDRVMGLAPGARAQSDSRAIMRAWTRPRSDASMPTGCTSARGRSRAARAGG
ncbi:hypothetical protein [Sorangium cellulosum]|nr:hypothetical protein [Sorangium cellulosum]